MGDGGGDTEGKGDGGSNATTHSTKSEENQSG